MINDKSCLYRTGTRSPPPSRPGSPCVQGKWASLPRGRAVISRLDYWTPPSLLDPPPELPASAHFLPGDSCTDLLMLCIVIYVTMETHVLRPLLTLPSPCLDLALHSFLSLMPLPHHSISQYHESPANPVAPSFWCLLAWQKHNSGEIQVFA